MYLKKMIYNLLVAGALNKELRHTLNQWITTHPINKLRHNPPMGYAKPHP